MSAADRARAERRAQGLPDVVEDVAVYATLARLLVAATHRDAEAGERHAASAR